MFGRSVRIAVDLRNPPFSEGRGEAIDGFSIDLVQAAFGHEGYAVDLVPDEGLPPQLTQLATHRVDAVLDITMTKRRKRQYAFSERYFVDSLGILGSAKGWHGSSLSHFRGRAAVKAYSYAEEWIRRHFPYLALEQVGSTGDQLESVRDGHALALITGHDTVLSLEAAGSTTGLSQRGSAFAPASLALATLPEDADAIITPFNAGLTALVRNGEWLWLRQKWLGSALN